MIKISLQYNKEPDVAGNHVFCVMLYHHGIYISTITRQTVPAIELKLQSGDVELGKFMLVNGVEYYIDEIIETVEGT